MTMLASDIRAEGYRSRARQALEAAASSPLLQVRDRQRAAASVWLELAAFEDRRSAYARELARGSGRGPQGEGPQGAEPPPCQS